MKYIYSLLFLFVFVSVSAQELTPEPRTVTNYNLIKMGSSIQANFVLFGRDYYYYDDFGNYYGYYYNDYLSETGPNTHVFLAYEHIWQFSRTNTAVAIEPQLGVSIFKYVTAAYTGANMKFFWVNKPNWRMGMATFFGYTYATRENTVAVPMDGGMYYQNQQVTSRYHQFSTDIALIPFQFRLNNIPIIIESQFAFFGLNVTSRRTENFDKSSDYYYDGNNTIGSIYSTKFELKIGYEF